MQDRTFGRLGWPVSEIGYGMWGMGGWTESDDDESRQALQLAVDLGCTFFDTAWGEDMLSGHIAPFTERIISDIQGVPFQGKMLISPSADTSKQKSKAMRSHMSVIRSIRSKAAASHADLNMRNSITTSPPIRRSHTPSRVAATAITSARSLATIGGTLDRVCSTLLHAGDVTRAANMEQGHETHPQMSEVWPEHLRAPLAGPHAHLYRAHPG